MELELPGDVGQVCAGLHLSGGSPIVVGGWVRDRLLGLPESKDLDIEVYGLAQADLKAALSKHGEVLAFGGSFPVLQVRGLAADISLPVAQRYPDGRVIGDHTLSFEEASRRRDLTINAIGWDPIHGVVLDPHGGRADLEDCLLRPTDVGNFGDDPLRAFRVAQLAARLEFKATPELLSLCRQQDLASVASERLYVEWVKLLLRSRAPSIGLKLLESTGLLTCFPELAALRGVPQDPRWHPEGDVWIHTLMVVDEAAQIRNGEGEDLALMFGALAHDFGKPATTSIGDDGAVRSPSHGTAGVPLTRTFLERLRAPKKLTAQVEALVKHHLAPALFVKQGSGPKAYRRLARKLAEAEVSIELLARTARADHLGRTTEEALRREFPACEEFLRRAQELSVESHPEPDVVMGRHLIARGLAPGPKFGEILARCRDVQDETGLTDAEVILDHVLEIV